MNGPNNLVRGFFLSLVIRLYVPPTFRPLDTFLGQFRGAQLIKKWKKNSMKAYFLVVLYNSSLKNGPNNLIRGLFLSLNIGPYVPSTFGLLGIFLRPFGVPK
jgi:hypothetical protein